MRFIHIAELSVGDSRQRQEFDPAALADLEEDIAAHGLLHPIVVRQEDTEIILVAGERRLRALSTLHEYAVPVMFDGKIVPLDTVPCVTLGELSEFEAMEVELSENIIRADLTWQERSTAIAQLHELRTQQGVISGTTQTIQATASEVLKLPQASGAQVEKVRQAITIAKHLADPSVSKASSPKEALKVIEKKLVAEHNEKLAQEVGKTAIRSRHSLWNLDAREVVLKIDSASVDCICSDPPYGVNAQDFGSQAKNDHEYDDSPATWEVLMHTLAEQFWRICKPQAHVYLFCDFKRFPVLQGLLAQEGFDVWPQPLIWAKSTGMLPLPEHGPRRQYECILFANKGKRKTTAVFGDVIIEPSDHTTNHPAQKPILLYTNLLGRSCRPGDVVFDPFAGSGTIFPAANRLSLRAMGAEINPEYYGIALQRMEAK
jgi:site-specific DNA-methyltransferase (adenine-specific)